MNRLLIILLLLFSVGVFGQINTGTNFRVTGQLPIDKRFVYNNITERDALSESERYEGLTVYIKDLKKNFQLRNCITNSCWEELADSSYWTIISGSLVNKQIGSDPDNAAYLKFYPGPTTQLYSNYRPSPTSALYTTQLSVSGGSQQFEFSFERNDTTLAGYVIEPTGIRPWWDGETYNSSYNNLGTETVPWNRTTTKSLKITELTTNNNPSNLVTESGGLLYKSSYNIPNLVPYDSLTYFIRNDTIERNLIANSLLREGILCYTKTDSSLWLYRRYQTDSVAYVSDSTVAYTVAWYPTSLAPGMYILYTTDNLALFSTMQPMSASDSVGYFMDNQEVIYPPGIEVGEVFNIYTYDSAYTYTYRLKWVDLPINHFSTYNPKYGIGQNIFIGDGGKKSMAYSDITYYGSVNTAIGFGSMFNNTTGFSNVAVGRSSLLNNTSGNNNTAIGMNSLWSNTTGSYNSGIGMQSLRNNKSGNNNTALGYAALLNDTVSDNTAIGSVAGYNITSGTRNVAIGVGAMYYTTLQSDGVAIGYLAGNTGFTSGSVIIGSYAGSLLVTPSAYNIALGNQAMMHTTNATSNIAIGNMSMRNQGSGSYNIGIGQSTLKENSGDFNIAIGHESLHNITGNHNIAIGYQAGQGNSKDYRLYIGEGGDTTTIPIYGNMLTNKYWINGDLTTKKLYIDTDSTSTSGKSVLVRDNITGEVTRTAMNMVGTVVREAHANSIAGVACTLTWDIPFDTSSYTFVVNGFDIYGNNVETYLVNQTDTTIVIKTLVNSKLHALAKARVELPPVPTYTIEGTIIYDTILGTKKGVKDIRVDLYQDAIVIDTAWTGTDGYYKFDVPAGNYIVTPFGKDPNTFIWTGDSDDWLTIANHVDGNLTYYNYTVPPTLITWDDFRNRAADLNLDGNVTGGSLTCGNPGTDCNILFNATFGMFDAWTAPFWTFATISGNPNVTLINTTKTVNFVTLETGDVNGNWILYN